MSPRDIGLALLITVLWGANFVVMKHGVSEVPPLALTGLRFTLATLPAIFFVAKPDVPWRLLLGFGALFGIIKFGLLFTAFQVGMPSGLASLLLQMQAALTIAVAYVWLRERPARHQWLGLGVALAGTGVILSGVAGDATLLPVLLTLAAATAWSFANLVLKRMGRVDALGVAVWTSILPGPAMLIASVLVEGPAALPQALADASWLGWGAILYLAYPISLLSGALWAGLLARYPIAVVAPFPLLVPVVGFSFGWLVYGETLSGRTAAGAVIVIAGLAISVLGGRRSVAGRVRMS